MAVMPLAASLSHINLIRAARPTTMKSIRLGVVAMLVGLNFLSQVDGWSSKNDNKRGGITELSERDKMAPLMKSLNDDGKEEISMMFTDNGTHAVSVDQGNRCAATTHGIICAMHVLDGLKKQESGPSS
jgi:hypothetical protein